MGLEKGLNSALSKPTKELEIGRPGSFGASHLLYRNLSCDQPYLPQFISQSFNLYEFCQYEKKISWSLPTIEHDKARNILDTMIPINEACA